MTTTSTIRLEPLEKSGITWAQETVTRSHYLHRPVDGRCSVEGYQVDIDITQGGSTDRMKQVGLFLFGRPEATRVNGWYGSVADVEAGRCECTRWQVLNLARVWFSPDVQKDGFHFLPRLIPGYWDRKHRYRSTLASDAIRAAVQRIGFDYLIRRPPCFLEEPYQIRWLLSYCDTSLHKGTIYAAAGFELYRTNDRGIQTWRIRLPPLTGLQDSQVREASRINPRSNRYRAQRAQLSLGF
jgi:hypothetical protein